MKVKKQKICLAKAAENALAAWADFSPLLEKKVLNGLEMTKALCGLIYLQKLLPALQDAMIKEWPEFAEIAKEIEETCYEH